MKTTLSAAGILIVLLAATAATALLPEEGLRRAQQAEQLLQAERVDEAVKVLEALAKDYPNEAAVHLRLAQVFDIRGMAGPALHCYRRYVELAGPKAIEEARLRVQTLELVATAREGAAAYAKARREATRAVATPTPVVTESVEVMRPDGSTAPLTPESLPQVLAEHAGAVSSGSAEGLAAPVFPGEAAPLMSGRAVSQETEPVTTGGSNLGRTPAAVPSQADRQSASASRPARVTATQQPELAATVRDPITPLPPPPTPPAEAHRSDAGRIRIAIDAPSPHTTPAAEPPRNATVAGVTARAEKRGRQDGTPAAAPREPDARTARFVEQLFRESRADGNAARVDLVNRFQMSVITFGAIPLGRGEPVNVILSTGERRSVTLSPGVYDVMLTVTGTTYPPTTIADRRFEFEFREGTRYSANFTTELFE